MAERTRRNGAAPLGRGPIGMESGFGGGGGAPLALSRGMFASLANRDFLLVWASNLGMMFAMQMQMVARGWLIYDMTSSALALAWVLLSMMGPMFVFSLVGGVLADRLRKKWLMLASQSFNIVTSIVLGVIILMGDVTFTHFLIFGFLNGIVLPLSMPARQAIIPEIVGEDRLVNAMALNTASQNLSRILAPTLAGVIIAVVAAGDSTSALGVGVIFFIVAALYVLSVGTLLALRHEGHSVMRERRSMAGDIGGGLRYVWGNSMVLGLLILAFIPLAFGMPIQFLLPAFNQDVLDQGPTGLGVLMGAMGVGALVGSLALAAMGDIRRKGLFLLGSALAWAFFMGLFAMTSNIVVALPLLGAIGFFSTIYMALNMTLVQLLVPAEMRGRVMSIMMMTFGLMPIGVFPMSLLAETAGIGVAFLAGAVSLGLLSAVVGVVVPAIARIDKGHGEGVSESANLSDAVAMGTADSR